MPLNPNKQQLPAFPTNISVENMLYKPSKLQMKK